MDNSLYIRGGRHYFIHNAFGSIYRGFLDWISDEYYPFERKIATKHITTYERAVAFFHQKLENSNVQLKQLLPAITLSPPIDMDYSNLDGATLGQRPSLAPHLNEKMWEPLVSKDGNFSICVNFTRMQGTMELLLWTESYYETVDFRLAWLLFTGGINRYIRPKEFYTNLVLPKELMELKDQNGVQIEWDQDIIFQEIFKTTGQTHIVMPIRLDPMFQFTGISDSSTMYGDDTVAEWKTSIQLTYHVNIPTFIIVRNDFGEKIDFNFQVGSSYSNYGIQEIDYTDPNMAKTVETLGNMNKTNDLEFKIDKPEMGASVIYTHDSISMYVYTSEDEDLYNSLSDEDKANFSITVNNPYTDVTDINNEIKIISYTGEIPYKDKWDISQDKSELVIMGRPSSGKKVEIHHYVKR